MTDRRTNRDGVAALTFLVFAGCGAAQYEPLARTPTAAAWVLIVPPNRYRSGAVRMDDRAPLRDWTRLAAFEDDVACEAYRDAHLAPAPDDEEWAMWSMARCATAERAAGGRLPPGD